MQTAPTPDLSAHLVLALDALWGLKNQIRGTADEAQWAMQDACSSLGIEFAHAAPEIRARADALARAQLGDRVRELAGKLRAIADKLEEGAACS